MAPPHPSTRETSQIGLLLGRGELVIRGADLYAADHPSPGLRLIPRCNAVGMGFLEPP